LKTRLTFGPDCGVLPRWSPDGKQIAFTALPQGAGRDIYVKAADGSGESEPLAATPEQQLNGNWTPDGSYLVFHRSSPRGGGYDLWYFKRKPDGRGFDAAPFLETPFNEQWPELSRDGRYVAYVSNEAGRPEIFVRPFPAGPGRWQLLGNGGSQPRWNRNGRELFYVQDDTLFAVAVSTTGGFSVGAATRLFQDPMLQSVVTAQYAVSADGKRFVLREPVAGDSAKPASIHVVQNWFAAFRDGRAEAAP
jgi:Tol biopolymer transport system component